MAIVNRCAVGIAPRPPLIDWSRRVSGDEAMTWQENDHSLYLLPSHEDDEERLEILERLHERIFTEELSSWCTDPALWPTPRSFPLFQEWFEIRFYDLVVDLGEDELCCDAIDPGFLEEVRQALQAPEG
jgi:hypothetical protein